MKRNILILVVRTGIFLFCVLLLHILVMAENKTTPEPPQEKVESQDPENLSKTRQDSALISIDSLKSKSKVSNKKILFPLSKSDTHGQEKTGNKESTKKINKTRSETVTTPFPASLFIPQLSLPLISYADTNSTLSYVYHKTFPHQNTNYHFLTNKLYSYSEKIDIKNNLAIINFKFGDTNIIPPFGLPLKKFWKLQTKKKFYKTFYDELTKSESEGKQGNNLQGIIPDIEFPKVKMPKAMRKIFGDNIGRLRVTGSQKITIGGSSTVNKPAPKNESSRKNVLPDLNMKQDLNLGINGTIGDKIKVDVKQSSEESIFKKNKINIKYEGDEDDPIKLIEAGDTQLSLSGSHFISYSASSKNLFGVKNNFELGKLKITTIASQQEGEHASASATGTSTQDFSEFRDMDFARNKYFYIGEPYSLFDDQGMIIDSLMPRNGMVRIFIDRGGQPDPNNTPGYSINDTNNDTTYHFQELDATKDPPDFFIDYTNSPYLITFNTYINNNNIIGIIYENRSDVTVGNYENYDPEDSNSFIKVKLIKKSYDTANLDEALWNYQLKNKYDLGSQNIEKNGFEVKIFHIGSDGITKEEYITLPDSSHITYAEFLGLDSNGDHKIDGNDNTVDLVNGVITFPWLRPFAEETFNYINPTFAYLGNDAIYEKLNPDPDEDVKFYINIKMKKTSTQINLGKINIAPNSEKVYVNGELKKKNVDYDIDYMGGTVMLKGDAALDPSANVKINFEYTPLFAIEKKSMLGLRADYEFNKNAKLGTTIMYEGESVKDQRPKVGSEPQKIIVGDIDGNINLDMPFATTVINKIPLVKTQEKSSFSLSGEVAMNIPSPNATKKKEAYLEDMESVVEAFSLGVGRTDWTFASFPVGIVDTLNADTLNKSSRGDMKWYNPYHKFHTEDIYQDLSEKEKNDYVSVLECKLNPDTNQSSSWGGIMKAFGNSSIDFSKKKYIEVMLKSENVNEGDSLFIDLGFISEDFYPIMNPNGALDKEDGVVNGIEDGKLDVGEDVGLDRKSGNDPDPPNNHYYDGTSEVDDGNDDHYYDPGSTDYSQINGTEGNDRLDGEDLDASGRLDTSNNYFQYALDLANIGDDVQISEYKGWKFIRIPLQDSTYFKKNGSGNVDFSHIKYARIWAKTTSTSPLTLDFVSCDVVGNKWKASAILDTSLAIVDSTCLADSEEFAIATDNNKKNPDYVPPPGSIDKKEEERAKEKQLEQSIFLKCTNIQPNRYIYARENFSEAVNLLLYDKIKLWVYGKAENITATPEETIIFRLGADTSNYYECRKNIDFYDINEDMKENRWQQISIDFAQLSGLKKSDVPDTSKELRIKGKPSLSKIKQITVGLIRPDSLSTSFSGKVYFDDIILANPYDKMGIASRISLNAKLADLATITASFRNMTPNFYSLGASSGPGSNTFTYSIGNKIQLNKFLPDSWGFNIPLKLDYSLSESKPRFQPNSDVELTSDAEKDSLKTSAVTRSASVSLTKSKKSSNPIIKYFVDNTSLSGKMSKNESLSPTKKDSTLKYSGTFDYNLNFSKDNSLNIFKNFKIFYLPQKIKFNFGYNYNRSNIWDKQTGDETGFIKKMCKPIETAIPKFSVNYEIFSDFNTDYSWEATRDLQKRLLINNINVGIENNKKQKINLKYNPGFLKFLGFSSKYSTSYDQTRQETNNADSLVIIQYDVGNNRTITGGVSLKFDKWGKGLINAMNFSNPSKNKKNSKKEEKHKSADETPKDTEPKKHQSDLSDSTKANPVESPDDLDKEELSNSGTKSDTTKILQKNIKEEKKPKSPIITVASIAGKAVGYSIRILGTINLNYTNNFNTKYYTKTDSLPDFGYQVGLYELEYGELHSSNISDDFSASASNKFNILHDLSANLNTKYEQIFSNNLGTKKNSNSLTLPDITLTYSGLDRIIPWNLVSNSSFSNGVSRTVTEEISTVPKNSQKTTFNSSLSLPINLLKKVNPKLSSNYSLSHNKNFVGKTQNRNQTMGITGGIQYSIQTEKGIKIPLFKRIKIKNKLDTNLDITYNSNINQDYIPSKKKWNISTNTHTLKIEPRVSYSFSRDINGGLTGKYENTKNVKEGKSTQTTSLNLWVEFKF